MKAWSGKATPTPADNHGAVTNFPMNLKKILNVIRGRPAHIKASVASAIHAAAGARHTFAARTGRQAGMAGRRVAGLRSPAPGVLCASLCILLASCNGTKHLYVATTGSDANPGTRDEPLKTIARADALARPGCTIHVGPGTYEVNAPSARSAGIRTTKSGTASARIKFVSDVKWGAKIVFSGKGIAWNSKGAYVDIDGFDISGTGRIGILAEGGRENITNNFIHDLTVSGGCNSSGGAAINIWGAVGGAVIDSNVIRNICGQWLASRNCNTVQGIYVANHNNRISNNIISGVASVGINSWHGATDSTIVNNTIFNSKMGIVIGQGDSGATAVGTQNNYVANNIVYRNAYGISEMGKVGGNNRYIDNLVHSNGNNWRVKGTVSGTISADPLFMNYQPNGAGDYRLQSKSPAVGRGASNHLLPPPSTKKATEPVLEISEVDH